MLVVRVGLAVMVLGRRIWKRRKSHATFTILTGVEKSG